MDLLTPFGSVSGPVCRFGCRIRQASEVIVPVRRLDGLQVQPRLGEVAVLVRQVGAAVLELSVQVAEVAEAVFIPDDEVVVVVSL